MNRSHVLALRDIDLQVLKLSRCDSGLTSSDAIEDRARLPLHNEQFHECLPLANSCILTVGFI